MLKTAIAIRHVAFEDPGSLQPILAERGYAIRIYDAGMDDLSEIDPIRTDLLVALGGPIGAYEEDRYGFIATELRLLDRRLAAGRPTLGICLGAQMMARVLGGTVYSGPGKEIGWSSLALSPEGLASPLAELGEVPVLHWHGDTFDLPPGALRLASTPLYTNQAFSMGSNLLGLQFHAEIDADGIERWLIGHACELAAAGIDPNLVRADSRAYGRDLKKASGIMFRRWLDTLESRQAEL